MKAVVLCTLAVIAMASARPNTTTYTDRYDNINIDEVLGNKRLLNAYVNCALETGKCSAEGRELRSHIQEALENNCDKCTEWQRNGTRKVIGHLINHENEMWTKLSAKYDPKRKYVVKYEKDLRVVQAEG